jgi:hypothetical protein
VNFWFDAGAWVGLVVQGLTLAREAVCLFKPFDALML